MDRDTLLKLLSEDDVGLLDIKKPLSAADTENALVISRFSEINDFVKVSGREPGPNMADFLELQLYSRLKAFREDKSKIEILALFDQHALLGTGKSMASISDVFSDDDLGLLNDDADSIFVLKHVPAAKEINLPDYIAKRKPCNDFEDFESLFKECHQELAAGKRKLAPFSKGSLISQGDYFVLKGVLVYVAAEGKRHPTADRNTFNARLRCIFENGTESDMLLRSLAAALYKEDGRRVTRSVDMLPRAVHEINEQDVRTGYIYILKSLSDRPEIKGIKDLYKIGFSTTAVEERIKNAAQEATYLMAPVKIIATFQCYNVNTQKLESLLHIFFGTACLDVDVYDSNGRRCLPREWFVAPISVITTAVEMFISGEIVNFRYDEQSKSIIPK